MVAKYRNGEVAAVGDEIVLVGAVDAILPNDELAVDVGPTSVRVASAQTLPIDQVSSGGGGGVDWEINDPFDTFEANRWSNTGTGDGQSFIWPASTQAWLLSDPGNGYLRVTCGAGSAATDRGRLYHDNVDDWNTILGSVEQRFRWRLALNATGNLRAAVGLCRAAPTAARPSPGVVFLFDSTEGFRVQHDDGAGKTSDASAGDLSSFNQKFREVEFRTVAGQIEAYVDDDLVATIDADLPAGSDACLSPFAYVEGAGSTWRTLALDRFRYGRSVA